MMIGSEFRSLYGIWEKEFRLRCFWMVLEFGGNGQSCCRFLDDCEADARCLGS